MNWEELSKQPELSEEFMKEHAATLDWVHICLQKNVSVEFMKEMVEYIFLDSLKYRFQKGDFPYIDQKSFASLQSDYLTYWQKQIVMLRHSVQRSNEVHLYTQTPKPKVQIFFHLHKTFHSEEVYTDLSITFHVASLLTSSDWAIDGFSKTKHTKKWNISLSRLFSTGQQKDAFFHCINQYLLSQKLIQGPITFFYQ